MKKIAFLLILFTVTFLVGCDEDKLSVSRGDGMVENRHARRRRLAACNDYYNRQLQDDWDLFWLYDSNSMLTEWTVYVGD
jgi:hypothetical protein